MIACFLMFAELVAGAGIASRYLSSPPINGAMQLLNPIRRLEAGQQMGIDFASFHGPGVLLWHYLLAKLAGGGLSGTLFAMEFATVALYFSAFLLFAHSLRLPKAPVALFAAIVFLINEAGGLFITHQMGSLHGSSVYPVRTFLPLVAFFLAIIAHPFFRGSARPLAFCMVLGASCGAAVFISFEQGIFATAAAFLTLLIWPGEERLAWKQRAARASLFVASAAISAIVIYWGILGKSAWPTLLFFIRDIEADQFWYFGAPPNSGLSNVLLRFITEPYFIVTWLLFLSGVAALAWWRRQQPFSPAVSRACGAFIYLGIYSLISQVSNLAFVSHYSQTLARTGVFIWLFVLYQLLLGHSGRLPGTRWLLAAISSRLLWLAPLCLLAAGLFVEQHTLRAKFSQNHETYQGITISEEWRRDLAFCASIEREKPRFASTYSGLIEDRLAIFSPAEDYMIHSLGSHRPEYVKKIQDYDPDYFATIAPAYSRYENWLQVSHWDLYRWLLQNYHVVESTPSRIFWKRNQQKGLPVIGDGGQPFENLKSDRHGFVLEAPAGEQPQLFEVRLRYKIQNPFGRVPVLGKTPRYLVMRNFDSISDDEKGRYAVSLPPHLSEWTFPVLAPPGRPVRSDIIATQTFGLGAECSIISAEARPLGFPESSRPALAMPH